LAKERIEEYLLDLILPAAFRPSTDDDEEEDEDEEPKVPAKYLLCDEANLYVFGFWYAMGGHTQPPTLAEAAELPATVARDFRTLLKWVEVLKMEHQGMEHADDEGIGGIEESLSLGGFRRTAEGFVRTVRPDHE
jgi:hypothetical protein